MAVNLVLAALAGNDMAQLTCTNQSCRLPLMYPRGARQVQCSVCGTLNDSMAANAIGHVICDLCHITLMVPSQPVSSALEVSLNAGISSPINALVYIQSAASLHLLCYSQTSATQLQDLIHRRQIIPVI